VKLERILQNLVSNGIKFTERGRVEVIVRTSGRDVVIHVVDTGVGIPPAQWEAIFEEFYQADNCERDSTKGFGLGLSISRRLARQLRGDLTVESEVGRGSRFSLTLLGVIDGNESGASPAEPTALSRGNPASPARG
jgi:signal transduction histidine kinase